MKGQFVFYREEKFKETPIGKIPEDWEVVKLGSIAYFESGKRPKGGAKEKGDVLSIGGEHINDSGNLDLSSPKFISMNFYTSLKRGILKTGDIIMCKDGAKTGKVAYVKKLDYHYASVNEHIFIIRSKDLKIVNNEFIFYVLFSNIGQNQVKAFFHGIVGGITGKDLSNLKIPLPPLLEQKAIAHILSTIDEAIQKTNEIIAKTERLKKGVMQELLTRGIGHKEFKDTEIGRIPKKWKVARLKDVCIKITDGSHWSPKEVEKSNYRIATVTNMKETYIDVNSCKFISREDYLRLVKEGDVPKKGDVLFSKDGTVGISFAFKQDNYNIGLLSSIAIIRPNHQVLFSDFIPYALKSPNVFWQIIGRKTGTALRRIILNHLKTVKIPVPPLPEQEKIVEILSTIDKKLEVERKRKEKLERIKKVLMDLLLTGKIRVKI